jgi:hypothetical protein
MPVKPMTDSEKLVGRRHPKGASPMDQFMAAFLASTGTPIMRMKPDDDDKLACHRKARRLGWIRSGIPVYTPSGGQKALYWELTGPGVVEATAALGRVNAALANQQAWAREFLAKHREKNPIREDLPKLSEKNFSTAPSV